MKEQRYLDSQRLFFLSGLISISLLSFACGSQSVNNDRSVSSTEAAARNAADARSPSSLEALSRGLAAVTPPGAPLKDIYFDFDSPDLRDDARDILEANAEWMRAHPTDRVEIEGHCDDLGTAEYNLALGAKRAQAAKEFIVSLGIEPERLVTISYGKEAPACFEKTDECRKLNRRARFIIFTELPTS